MNRSHGLCFVLLGVACCARLPIPADDKALEKGRATGTKESLHSFLEDWCASSIPLPADMIERKPAFERVAYEVYRDWFTPDEGLYKDVEYVVIQDSIKVQVREGDIVAPWLEFGKEIAESPEKFSRINFLDPVPEFSGLPVVGEFTINHFKPLVGFDGKKVLYLDRNHLARVEDFLNNCNEQCEPDRGGVKEESTGTEERLAYLRPELTVFPSHWGDRWHVVTHPIANEICINSDGTQAIVFYRLHYGGGQKFLRRNSMGRWEAVAGTNELGLSWIE